MYDTKVTILFYQSPKLL